MRRRTLVFGLTAVGALSGLVIYGLQPVSNAELERRTVDKRLSDAERWAAFGELAARKLSPIRISEALLADFIAARSAAGRRLPRRRVQSVRQQLLFSTDFFHEGADPQRAPRFVMLYDPYINPCWSPFPPS